MVQFTNEAKKIVSADAKLTLEGTETTGGFRVFSRDTDLCNIDWQDAEDFIFDSEKLQASSNTGDQIKFASRECYEQFKHVYD